MQGIPDYEEHAPAFGEPLIEVDLETERPPQWRPPGSILVGLDRHARTPPAHEDYDLLLTTAADPPRVWVSTDESTIDLELARIRNRVRQRPLAAATLAQVLRAGARLSVPDAFAVESFAYSMLLGGAEFRNWRQAHPASPPQADTNERVCFTRNADTVCIRLANPARHNAIDARMRDALCEALHAVADDPTVTALCLLGEGRAFSVGGELEEFGTASDLAAAHAVRTLRSPALLLYRLRDRATAYVHGACIGSGIEMPAAVGRLIAAPDTWFRLPEVSMGLIPGAGGTVTISARVGRHRTLYWALTNRKLNADLALAWGLVDEIRRTS
jgi:hypothetical protein